MDPIWAAVELLVEVLCEFEGRETYMSTLYPNSSL